VKDRNTSLCAGTGIGNVDAEAKAMVIEAEKDIILIAERLINEQDATKKETNPVEIIPE
jgi:hypothetical protein